MVEKQSSILKNGERQLGPDVVRICACFLVFSVHFFYNNEFYFQNVSGAKMNIMVFMRTSFMVCVPLFIMLTGYLMRNQRLCASYYLKGVKTLIIYLLASTACILFRILYEKADDDILWGYLSYSGAPYAWYIEMYFGLFALIPFLNIMYNGIPSKKGKTVLIVTMFCLTSLPGLLNVYNFKDPGWWAQPTLSATYQQLFPAWWMRLYPLTYYFAGAYIGEYKPRPKASICAIFLAATVTIAGLYNCWRSKDVRFIWGTWSDYTSPFTVVMAVLVFLLLVRISGKKLPWQLRTVIGLISQVTLGAYLVSYIYDKLFYKTLIEKVPEMPDRLIWYFAIVPAVFVCSIASSFVLEAIYQLLKLSAGIISKKIKQTRSPEISA